MNYLLTIILIIAPDSHRNSFKIGHSSHLSKRGNTIFSSSLRYLMELNFLCFAYRIRAFSLKLIQDGFGQSLSSVAKIKLKVWLHLALATEIVLVFKTLARNNEVSQ